MKREIERKWVLPSNFVFSPVFFNLLSQERPYVESIQQFYLFYGKFGTLRLRLSKRGGVTHTYITHKSRKEEGLIGVDEIEESINDKFYYALLNEKLPKIEKVRYDILIEHKLTLSVDVFSGNLAGLVLAEIEFESEMEAQNYGQLVLAPELITEIEEVTNNSLFTNFNLCHGNYTIITGSAKEIIEQITEQTIESKRKNA